MISINHDQWTFNYLSELAQKHCMGITGIKGKDRV